MKSLVLKTKRLLITPLSDEEMRSMIDSEPDIEMKKAYNEMLVFSLENPENRQWYIGWKIILKDSGETVGDLCFKGPADETKTVEIGYGIYDEHQGKGYATEAVGKMCEWALSQDGVYFVDAETEKDNEKSKRVLEKLGFKYYREGEEGPRQYLCKKDQNFGILYMSLGLAVGMAFGYSVFSNITWMPISMLLGYVIGNNLDKRNKEEKDKLFILKGITAESEDGNNA